MKKILLALVLCVMCLAVLPASAAVIFDVEIPDDAVSCDFSSLDKLIDKLAPKMAEELNAIPTLTACDMTGVRMSTKAALTLVEACPQIHFHFMLPVGKKLVDSEQSLLDIDSLRVGQDLKLSELERLMKCMPNLDHAIIYSCRFKISEVESLMAAFPQVEFEWTVRFSGIAVRNTATAYSTLKGRQDPRYRVQDIGPLMQYVPNLLALDLGHNNISDLSFLSTWPKLRRLIIIDSAVRLTDISPLADLPDLEYVELFLQHLTDISPLANHTKLLDLNLCHNNITDLTPLYSCTNLQRLWISYNPHLKQEEIDAFKAALPNCVVETEEFSSTGKGWRLHDRYFIMYDSFKTQTYMPFAETVEDDEEVPAQE